MNMKKIMFLILVLILISGCTKVYYQGTISAKSITDKVLKDGSILSKDSKTLTFKEGSSLTSSVPIIVYKEEDGKIYWKHNKSGYEDRSFKNTFIVEGYKYCDSKKYTEKGEGITYTKTYYDCTDYTPIYINSSGKKEVRRDLINITKISNKQIQVNFIANKSMQYDPSSATLIEGMFLCNDFDNDYIDLASGYNGTPSGSSFSADVKKIGTHALRINASQYVSITDHVVNFPSGTASRTVIAWIWLDQAHGDWQTIIEYGQRSNNDNAQLAQRGDNDIYYNGFGADTNGAHFQGDENWFMVTGTRDGVNTSVWHGETFMIEDPETWTTIVSGQKARIGQSTSGSDQFKGFIDGLMYWSRELNTSEIEWIYNSGNGRSCSDLFPVAENNAPTVSLNSPVNDSGVTNTIQILNVTYSDSDSDAGTVEFINSSNNLVLNTQSSVTAGSTVNFTVTLEEGQELKWLVNVSDGVDVSAGGIWNFSINVTPAGCCTTNSWDCSIGGNSGSLDAGGNIIIADGDGVIIITGDITNCNQGEMKIKTINSCEVYKKDESVKFC